MIGPGFAITRVEYSTRPMRHVCIRKNRIWQATVTDPTEEGRLERGDRGLVDRHETRVDMVADGCAHGHHRSGVSIITEAL
jgi:hypothetical protein